MKKYMIFAVGAIVAITASIVNAADNVTVQLKWVTQTQFAGYYVAQDKGFYEAEGLNVTIKAGGPDIGPMSNYGNFTIAQAGAGGKLNISFESVINIT